MRQGYGRATIRSPGAGIVNLFTVLFTPSFVPVLSSEVTRRLGLEAGDAHAECRLRMTPIDPDGGLRRLAVLRQNLVRASLDDVLVRRQARNESDY